MKRLFCLIMIFVMSFSFMSFHLKDANGITARVKDIAYVQGVRDNQLYGYGIVIGLSGTGDSKKVINFTTRIISNVFEKLGVVIADREQDFISKNIAIVMVTADIPAFAKPGARLDVLVSTVGDAKSLKGGVLIQTPLQGADNEVYAVAQGPLSISGGENLVGDAQRVVKGHTTVATLPSGAIVEKEIKFNLFDEKFINIVLKDPDFTTSTRLVRAIDNVFGGTASSVSPAMVRVEVPEFYINTSNMVEFIAELEEISVSPDAVARIIINERTGTIVIGQNVRISTVAVAHGNLTITITESPEAIQPAPFGAGNTEVIPNTNIEIDETRSQLKIVPEGATVQDVARTLNVLGVGPRDLISIFQAIKKSGSLHAELVIM